MYEKNYNNVGNIKGGVNKGVSGGGEGQVSRGLAQAYKLQSSVLNYIYNCTVLAY